jgi:hypothetical protein
MSASKLAIELAYFAGWLEHASINTAKKQKLIAYLMDAASRLASKQVPQ